MNKTYQWPSNTPLPEDLGCLIDMMAGKPREYLGKRPPGELNSYEKYNRTVLATSNTNVPHMA